jgi:phospholipid/cholesterol/gamma-HCH transport system substrate-binding protein
MPSTRVKQNLIILSFFAALSLTGLVYMAINTGQRIGPLPPQFRLSFAVKDADGIAEGSDVRVAGIQIGRVLTNETRADGALITMGIDRQYLPIYSDATVLIRPKSLLGEKYVDMSRGVSNVEIPEGGMIPRSQAFTQVELDQVLNASDAATRKAVSTNLQNLGGGLQGRGADLNATIPELRQIAEHLSPVAARFQDRTAQIDHILVDTDTVLQTLADEHHQVATLLESADAVTGTIAQNDAHLANILNAGSSTLQRINTAVGQLNNDQNIRTATELAPGVLQKLDTFLSLTNHAVNTAVPSLLLGQQYSYPADQLTISQGGAFQTDSEWDSGTRIYDNAYQAPSWLSGTVFGVHGFLAIGVQCGDGSPGPTTPPVCPGTYLKSNNGIPSASSASTPGRVSLVDQQALIRYLLGT